MDSFHRHYLKFESQQIQKIAECMNIKSLLLGLQKAFVFKFKVKKILLSHHSQTIFGLACQLYKYLLYLVQSNSRIFEQQMAESSEKLISISKKLIHKISSDRLFKEVDIIFMLISLGSRNFFCQLLGKLQGNFQQLMKKEQYTIQSYTYMILIYKTTGNFVSPLVLNHLVKTYIKEIIFKTTHHQLSYLGMARSLKYIETQLSKKDTMVGGRAEEISESRKGKNKKFQQFIKSVLKTKFDHQEIDKKLNIDEVSESFEKCLFNKENKLPAVLAVLEEKKKKFRNMSTDGKNEETEPNLKKVKINVEKSKSVFEKITEEYLQKRKRKSFKTVNILENRWKETINSIREEANRNYLIEQFDKNIQYNISSQRGFDDNSEEYEHLKISEKDQEQFLRKSKRKQTKKTTLKFVNLKEKTLERESDMFPKIKKSSIFLRRGKKDFQRKCKERLTENQ